MKDWLLKSFTASENLLDSLLANTVQYRAEGGWSYQRFLWLIAKHEEKRLLEVALREAIDRQAADEAHVL